MEFQAVGQFSLPIKIMTIITTMCIAINAQLVMGFTPAKDCLRYISQSAMIPFLLYYATSNQWFV